MTTVHLVRHGESDWNLESRVQGQTDSSLTPLGVQQAHAAAESFKDLSFVHAYCSTSLRARHTAEIIVAQRGIPLVQDARLREINLGVWEGHLYEHIRSSDPMGYTLFRDDPSTFRVEGAETFVDLQRRALQVFHEIAARHPGDAVLVVGHGAFFKTLLAHFEGRHLRDLWAPPKIKNCGHSILEAAPGGRFRIRQYSGMTAW